MDKDWTVTENHWTAGVSCEELSKLKWYFEHGVGTREELAVPMHIAGACSRIATALERIADLMDPEVRARKEAKKKRDDEREDAWRRAKEIAERHWPKDIRTRLRWERVLGSAILCGIDTKDLRVVAKWSIGNVARIGKKTGEELLAEAELVMGTGGGAK